MVSFCYICKKTGNSEPKTFMFKPNKENLEEWHQAIGRKERPLKISHKICENHFDPDDVIRYDKFMINGQEILLPKITPILKPGAVPNKKLISSNKSKEEMHDEVSLNNTLFSNLDSPILSYDELMNQTYEVIVPSEEWALHKNGKIASFIHVSYDEIKKIVVMDKLVLFKDTFKPECYLKDTKCDINIECTSTDAISRFLKLVDTYTICTKGDANCKGFCMNDSTYCSNCGDTDISRLPRKRRKVSE